MLEVAVFEVEELSQSVVVTPAGNISMPLIGEMSVDGMTTPRIEQRLKELYGRDYLRDPQISVKVKDFRSQPISVFGAVQRPGIYQLQGRRRLVEVLAMAGGLTEDVGDTITIFRTPSSPPAEPGNLARSSLESWMEPAPANLASDLATLGRLTGHPEEIKISVRELLTMGGHSDTNRFIDPHDVIRISKAGVIYVMGAVEKPGGFPIKEQETITVLRAVSLASGLKRHASPQKARVIRDVNGVKRELPVRIKDVLAGKAPDLSLDANDILFVPDSGAKSALSRSVDALIQVGTGVAIFRR